MTQNQSKSFWIVGLALFSMFFGSGNLIYPLFVGMTAGTDSFWAILGFLIGAVCIPFIGVMAMVVFDGDYTSFFSKLGNKVGFALATLLLTVWIPLGSAPRCVVVAYGSIQPIVQGIPLWLFSAVYCLLVYWMMQKKGRIIDILGSILTPLLLVCLGLLFIWGNPFESLSFSYSTTSFSTFCTALQEGYNTMDLIAAFFFAASIIEILRGKRDPNKTTYCSTTVRACLVGMILLGFVYIGLILLASQNTLLIADVPKNELLSHIAFHIMGPYYGMVASLAILLACFTTSIALIMVFSEFLLKTTLPYVSKSPKRAIAVSLLLAFGISIFGIKGIAFLTESTLQICYPLLILLIIFQLSKNGWKRFRPKKAEVASSTKLESVKDTG